MRTFNKIYKYKLATLPHKIQLPKGAEILCVKVQQGSICLWAEVNPMETILEDRHIMSIPTGGDIEDNISKKYLDTVLLHSDTLVLHLFEIFP